ncbi:HalOD1 output domain-containing protein [Halogeometricum limi]|uniref:Halobacterial output domain-containing protein n=1 Tax=Halogeometricum limi TaxID=555875 RepID=A0A1I6G3X5_9EURY|nr:HalOD1 output domain-containing protein [Halogeometricum limi]SFR36904.1 hypothetical protein SAMN04488124_0831 [Halogeometricum limi]
MHHGNSDSTQSGIGPSTDSARRHVREIGPTEDLTAAIIEAVAAATGNDPMELPPLHREGVDAEAIATLLDGPTTDLTVTLSAYGHELVVESDRTLTIYDAAEDWGGISTDARRLAND